MPHSKPTRREIQYIMAPTSAGVMVALYGKTAKAREYLAQRLDHHIVSKEVALDLYHELAPTHPCHDINF